MSSFDRRSESRSPPPPRSRTPPEDHYSRPRTPERGECEDRRSRSGSRGRSGSGPRSGRRTPPSDGRDRSRSPRGRSGSYERRPRHYSGSPPRGRGRPRDDRDAPEPNKCLGVFGLSLYTTERELEKHFNMFGRIDKCQVVLDGHSGRSRGFAFIYFETVEDASEARKVMDGKDIDGKQVRVDFSITKRPHTPTPGMYMGRPSRDFRRGSRGGGYRGGRGGYRESRGSYRDSRPSYGGGGDRYREERRYDDRERDRHYDDRRDDRYYDRRPPPPPSYGGYPDDRYDSYPPTNSYGKRPRPRSPSPYERDTRPRREYRSRSREYDRRY